MKRMQSRLLLVALCCALMACGGGPGTPSGSVVNSPGGGANPPPTQLVDAHVTVTLPLVQRKRALRPDYLSRATQSLSIQLASANGEAVTGAGAVTVNTYRNASNCKASKRSLVCSGVVTASPGNDEFAVTAFAWPNATGAILSAGTIRAHVGGTGGGVPIDNRLSLSLDGIVASLRLTVSPASVKRGVPSSATVALQAFDAAGATIVGPGAFQSPIVVSISGDAAHAFGLHGASQSGESLSIAKPASNIRLTYDGNANAAPISIQAVVAQDASATVNVALRGSPPPQQPGTMYVLNAGKHAGLGATVTEYDATANGNAAPVRTLQLDSGMYARGIAVASDGTLYVGYTDNALGFNASTGIPDAKNEIAVYAATANGKAAPSAVLQSDPKTQSTLYPLFLALDANNDLVTYGGTTIDASSSSGSTLADAVLTYAAGASGAVAPSFAWNFTSPYVHYPGPTGLALDSGGNFYVDGALKTELSPQYGIYVASASDRANRAATPARIVPWDAITQLLPQQAGNVSLDGSGELYVANVTLNGSRCQAAVNVFAAGASGGKTDVAPLRVLTLDGFSSSAANCNGANPLAASFPSIVVFGSSIYASDAFNDAIGVFRAASRGSVTAAQRIAGSATGLQTPIAIAVAPQSHATFSGREIARPGSPSLLPH